MYSIFEKYLDNQGNPRLCFQEDEIRLAGSKNGIIVKALREILKPGDHPPCGWKIPVRELYMKRNETIVIDIKPNNSDEIVLCELDTVFGFSHDEWTPIMFRLFELYNDFADGSFEKEDFAYPVSPPVLYTLAYLSGSFQNGEIIGSWRWPGKSSTNSGFAVSQRAQLFFCADSRARSRAFAKSC